MSQTYRLWVARVDGTLKMSPRRSYFQREIGGDWRGGPGAFMPDLCPFCGDVDSLELTDEDADEMTDGQLAEYIAGTQGGAFCTTCGSAFAWRV